MTVHAEWNTGDGIALVRQVAYVVKRADKLAALCRILDVEDPGSALVFARTHGYPLIVKAANWLTQSGLGDPALRN